MNKRAENGKKPFESLDKKEYAFDEETGEEIELKKTKHIKESTTDPECGLFHKVRSRSALPIHI